MRALLAILLSACASSGRMVGTLYTREVGRGPAIIVLHEGEVG